MLEVAVVVASDGLYWHEPAGRSSASIPDSRALWDAMWSRRATLIGVAHTHPGGGRPVPSSEDLGTFAACEAGLGRRLAWWIATRDACVRFDWVGPGARDYAGVDEESAPWLEELRRRSYGEGGAR